MEVAGVDGWDRVLRLRGGGVRVYLPATIKDEHHWLSKALGFTAAKDVCSRAYSTAPLNAEGRRTMFPIFSLPLFETTGDKLKARIRKLLTEGVSVREVAKRIGVHDRTVRRHKARLGREGRSSRP